MYEIDWVMKHFPHTNADEWKCILNPVGSSSCWWEHGSSSMSYRNLYGALMLSFCPGSGAIIGPFVVVAKGVKIGDEAIIEASCLIGEDTIIGKRVVIGQRVVVGNDCDIRDDVVLGKDAVIGTRSTIERGLRIPGGYKVPTNSHLRNLTANEAAEVTAASSMYCSCTAPKIITNTAGGNVFQYCQRCKKEYI